AVAQAGVREVGCRGGADPHLAEVATVHTFGAVDPVLGGAGYRRPGHGHTLIEDIGFEVVRHRWRRRAAAVLNGWRRAGDLVAVEGRKQRRHVGRAVGEIAVVVVGGQEVQVAAVGIAAAGAIGGALVPVHHRVGAHEG